MHLLSNLLPYEKNKKKNKDLQIALYEYQSLLAAALEASKALEVVDLEKFDALVGENACQIRAIWISLITSKALINIECFKARIHRSIKHLEFVLESKKMQEWMRSGIDLEEVLKEEKMDVSLSEEELFGVQSFILTEMKEVKREEDKMSSLFRMESTAIKKYKKFGEVSTSFARHLANKLKEDVSKSSVTFVRNRALTLEDASLINMTSEDFTIEHHSLSCIPLFSSSKTILKTALAEKIPLILHIKFLKEEEEGYIVTEEEYVCYKSNHNGSSFQYEETTEELNNDTPAFVIQGVVNMNALSREEWKRNMNNRSIEEVFLACAADHKQYPDASVDRLKDPEYQEFKKIAKEEGFSSENSRTFFIQHVYAARAGNLIQSTSLETISCS